MVILLSGKEITFDDLLAPPGPRSASGSTWIINLNERILYLI